MNEIEVAPAIRGAGLFYAVFGVDAVDVAALVEFAHNRVID
jgi:hypothetical protein